MGSKKNSESSSFKLKFIIGGKIFLRYGAAHDRISIVAIRIPLVDPSKRENIFSVVNLDLNIRDRDLTV